MNAVLKSLLCPIPTLQHLRDTVGAHRDLFHAVNVVTVAVGSVAIVSERWNDWVLLALLLVFPSAWNCVFLREDAPWWRPTLNQLCFVLANAPMILHYLLDGGTAKRALLAAYIAAYLLEPLLRPARNMNGVLVAETRLLLCAWPCSMYARDNQSQWVYQLYRALVELVWSLLVWSIQGGATKTFLMWAQVLRIGLWFRLALGTTRHGELGDATLMCMSFAALSEPRWSTVKGTIQGFIDAMI